MTPPNDTYVRLPGRSHHYFGFVFFFECLLSFGLICIAERCRIYRGPDHLMIVRRVFFSERVHRVYFSDIQSVTVRQTKDLQNANLMLLFSLAWFAVFSIIALSTGGFSLAAGPWFLIPLIGVLALWAGNLYWGPTCRVDLYTSVHRESLPCLGRLHSAQQVLADILPRITAVQGAAASDTILQSIQPLSDGIIVPKPRLEVCKQHLVATPQNVNPLVAQLHHESGRFHSVSFALMFLIAASSLFDFFVDWQIKNALDTFLLSVLLFCLAVSMGRQRNSDLPMDLQKLSKFAIIGFIIFFYVGQGIGYTEAFSNPEYLQKGYYTPPTSQTSPILVLNAILILYCVTLGLLGFVSLVRFRRSARLQSQPPAQQA